MAREAQTLRRLPMAAGGIIILLAAMWGGLQRMGWDWPGIGFGAVVYHGPLMIGGFLGTLLSLERAVALGKRWTYSAPIGAALGGLCLLAGWLLPGQILMLLASVVLVVVFIWIYTRQTTLFIFTMGLGAVAWMVGNALWLGGWSIPEMVPWWIAFLVLTIVGERLELSRFLPRLRWRHTGFAVSVGLYAAGVLLSTWWLGLGWVISGAGMIAMSIWLLIHDLTRRTIRQKGLARFAACCLLSGYFWLAAGGVLAIIYTLIVPLAHGIGGAWLATAPVAGLQYDAILHALLLGFVFVMIFGHAPVIFPAVLHVRMSYHPRFYFHLILLEFAVILRIVADLAGGWSGREWGGLLAAIAIVIFLLQTVTSISRYVSPPNRGKPQPQGSGRTISLGAVYVPEQTS